MLVKEMVFGFFLLKKAFRLCNIHITLCRFIDSNPEFRLKRRNPSQQLHSSRCTSTEPALYSIGSQQGRTVVPAQGSALKATHMD